MAPIGQQIAQLRAKRGLSVRQLADLCGMDYSNLNKIERGTYNASIAIINKILIALDAHLKIAENMTITDIENRIIVTTAFGVKNFADMPELKKDCAILIVNAASPFVVVMDTTGLNESETEELVQGELNCLTRGCNYSYNIIQHINNCYFCN